MAELRRFESDSWCFGCGDKNPGGLRLTFVVTGPGLVECEFLPQPHHCGSRPVVHGGIQAAVLDEVMGKAAQLGLPQELAERRTVTAEISLRYRKPVPMDSPLRATGRFERIEDRDVFVTGSLMDAAGTPLTTATARWRLLESLR